MKVPLISRLCLLEFRNSSVLSMLHLYFLMKKAASADELLD
jgi:hypothetical protein